MREKIEFILILVWSLLELANAGIILKFYLKVSPKKRNLSEVIIKCAIFTLIIVGYGLWVVMKYNQVAIAVIFLVIIYLKSGIVLSSFYNLKIRHFTMIALFASLVSIVGFNISLMFNRILKVSISYNYFYDVLGEILLMLVLLGILYFKQDNVISVWIASMSSVDHILYLIIFLCVGIIEVQLIETKEVPATIKVVLFMTVISIITLIIKAILITEKNITLADINTLLEGQMKQATDYYNEIVEKDNQAKKFRHDLKNLLLVLHTMIEEGKLDKAASYIAELQEVCGQLKPKYDTGNFMADAILSAKETKATQNNIQIEYDGFIPAEKVKDVDMVVVLSNVLDNAIEACENVKGEKVININSVLRKNIWVLNVDNPSNQVVIKNNNQIQTSKKEKKAHGFGLLNIERTAKKYDGSMQLNYVDGRFKTTVTLMLS